MGFDTRVKFERVARYRPAPNAAFVDRWQVEGAMMSYGPIALLVRCRYRNPGPPLRARHGRGRHCGLFLRSILGAAARRLRRRMLIISTASENAIAK